MYSSKDMCTIGERMTKEYKVKVFDDGTIEWYNLEGQLHRDDGPAMVHKHFSVWYKNGDIHRLDGPAVVCADGKSEEWYIEGEHPRDIQLDQIDATADFVHDNKLYAVIKLVEDLIYHGKVELSKHSRPEKFQTKKVKQNERV